MFSLQNSVPLFFLYCYVISLMFGVIPYINNTSFSFLFGGLYIIIKLTGFLYKRKWPKNPIIVYMIAILYLYLFVSEGLWHDQSVVNSYYISFGLNCLMLVLIVEEFSSRIDVMEMSMWLYCTTAVAIAILMTLNIFTSISDSSRVTFLQQNENEISAYFMVAFVFLSKFIKKVNSQKKIHTSFFILSSLFILNAIIITATRFTILTVFFVLILLVVSLIRSKSNVRHGLIFSASCLLFLLVRVIDFSPAAGRFDPQVQGNNLADLGGRIPLWRTSIDAFLDSPWLGMGYTGFRQFAEMQAGHAFLPHNFFLTVAVTGGIVGLLLLAIIVYLIVKHTLYFDPKHFFSDSFFILIPLFVISIMLNVHHFKVFWFLLACLIASLYATPKGLRG